LLKRVLVGKVRIKGYGGVLTAAEVIRRTLKIRGVRAADWNRVEAD
jgi:hypothetical protein